MAGLVTKETDKSVEAFIESIQSPSKREDSYKLIKIITELSGFEPKIWGDNFIIGFGKYSYTRKNGKEEFEWFHLGFAPRKTKITIYLTCDLTKEEELLQRLGKCNWGKGCLYIKKLADIDLEVLKKLIQKTKGSTWN